MFRFTFRERGQALVLLAIGIVGLIGLTALAIDGGRAFADRRHAQNAADNAAYAGGFGWIRDSNGTWVGSNWSNNTVWQQPAYNVAAANSYTNDADSSVSLAIEPYNDCLAIAPTGPVLGALVSVEIQSTLDTLFAPVIGVQNTHTTVNATAIACKEYTGLAGLGQAAVSCNKTDCYTFEFAGNNNSKIQGSGAFVNSSCSGNGNQKALRGYGSGTVQIPFGIRVVAPDYYWQMSNPPNITTNVPQIDCFENIAPLEQIGVTCSSAGSEGSDIHGRFLNPGTYNGTFPPGQAGTLYLKPGIYCLNGDWRQNSNNWKIRMHPDANIGGGQGVTFVINADVAINGGSVNVTGQRFGAPINGRLLMYAPFYGPNKQIIQHTITINGNNDSSFTGTLFAPTSRVTLTGTAGNENTTWTGQVIGDTIAISGTVNWDLIYDEDNRINVLNLPTISMQR